MALMTKLKKATLLEFSEEQTPSGVYKKTWKKVKDIKIAIHKVDDFYNPQGYKHVEVTHVGLTFERGIKTKQNRIRLNNIEYEVLNCDNSHRLTHMTLKEHISE